MIISMLLLAWILSGFNLDQTLIAGINEIFSTDFSTNVYWLAAFAIGAIGDLIAFFKR